VVIVDAYAAAKVPVLHVRERRPGAVIGERIVEVGSLAKVFSGCSAVDDPDTCGSDYLKVDTRARAVSLPSQQHLRRRVAREHTRYREHPFLSTPP
jgi:hypothetical protein